jgi:hypothetical protein
MNQLLSARALSTDDRHVDFSFSPPDRSEPASGRPQTFAASRRRVTSSENASILRFSSLAKERACERSATHLHLIAQEEDTQ